MQCLKSSYNEFTLRTVAAQSSNVWHSPTFSALRNGNLSTGMVNLGPTTDETYGARSPIEIAIPRFAISVPITKDLYLTRPKRTSTRYALVLIISHTGLC